MIKDSKERTEYYKQRNKNIVKFRVSAHEKTLLDIAMKEDGWENISGYVKYRLFGINPKTKLKKKIVSTQNKDNVRTYLSNLIQEHDMKIEIISSHLQSQCNNVFNERQTRSFYANILKEIFKMQDELKFMQQILSEQND